MLILFIFTILTFCTKSVMHFVICILYISVHPCIYQPGIDKIRKIPYNDNSPAMQKTCIK